MAVSSDGIGSDEYMMKMNNLNELPIRVDVTGKFSQFNEVYGKKS